MKTYKNNSEKEVTVKVQGTDRPFWKFVAPGAELKADIKKSDAKRAGLVEVGEPDESKMDQSLDQLTVAELKDFADKYGMEYKASIRKSELLALIQENLAKAEAADVNKDGVVNQEDVDIVAEEAKKKDE